MITVKFILSLKLHSIGFGIMQFVRVADKLELPPGSMKMVKVGSTEVLLVNLDGGFYAIQNRCTHSNRDLSSGKLSDNVVTCPHHGARFDVTTGDVVRGPRIPGKELQIANARVFEVKVEGEDILVGID
jgi:3-phenylpropionate/trans-cinnamate dioxygenase ferredoxin subunit